MKKIIALISIFLLLNISCTNVMATPRESNGKETSLKKAESESNKEFNNNGEFSQGFYSIQDLKLMNNVSYTVQNVSQHDKAFILIIDPEQNILEFIRLEPNSIRHCLRPLKYDYTILIYGRGQLVFS